MVRIGYGLATLVVEAAGEEPIIEYSKEVAAPSPPPDPEDPDEPDPDELEEPDEPDRAELAELNIDDADR